jgi:cytidine deaminase
VYDFIAKAKGRGLKIAVATSADAVKMEGNLREIRLPRETFDAVVAGDEVTRKKPDPEVFLLAATKLGLEGRECLVVEDAVNGVKAGCAAGARCLGITSTFSEAELRAAGAEYVARDLAGALDLGLL